MSYQRSKIEVYPFRQDLRKFEERWVSEELRAYATEKKGKEWNQLVRSGDLMHWEAPLVLSLPILDPSFASSFLEEMTELQKAVGKIAWTLGQDAKILKLNEFIAGLVEFLLQVTGYPKKLVIKEALVMSDPSTTAKAAADVTLTVCLTESPASLAFWVPHTWSHPNRAYHSSAGSLDANLRRYDYPVKSDGRGLIYPHEIKHKLKATSKDCDKLPNYIVVRLACVSPVQFGFFNRLPSEIQMMVFSYLGPKDLAAASMAHPTFASLIATQENLLWKPFFLTSYPYRESSAMEQEQDPSYSYKKAFRAETRVIKKFRRTKKGDFRKDYASVLEATEKNGKCYIQ